MRKVVKANFGVEHIRPADCPIVKHCFPWHCKVMSAQVKDPDTSMFKFAYNTLCDTCNTAVAKPANHGVTLVTVIDASLLADSLILALLPL